MGRCEFDDTGLAFTQIVKDSRLLAGVDWRSSQDLALRLGPFQPRLDPFADHCPLELGEDLLRENAIQTNLMRRDDVRDRYVLTGAGRRRISARGHAPSTILSFRKREVLRGGVPQRKPASIGFKE
jgi:hypothetical protein